MHQGVGHLKINAKVKNYPPSLLSVGEYNFSHPNIAAKRQERITPTAIMFRIIILDRK